MRSIKSIKEVEPFDIYDITVETDHCFKLDNGVIAHNSLFPRDVVSGGTGIYYSSDTIWILGRRQDKVGKEIAGYHFVINVEKSRFVKEKSQIPITVSFKGGIQQMSGLLDVALELGYVIKPKNGWYMPFDPATETELADKNFRAADTLQKEFWKPVFEKTDFAEAIRKKFQLEESELLSAEEESDIDPSEIGDDLEEE